MPQGAKGKVIFQYWDLKKASLREGCRHWDGEFDEVEAEKVQGLLY